MKKYLMMSMATLAFAGAFTSCSNDEGLYNGSSVAETFTAQQMAEYQAKFTQKFGQPAKNQTWGFGTTRSVTRSADPITVAGIDAPFDEAWVAEYLKTAKEADYNNTRDNYDNTSYAINYSTGGPNDIDWNNAEQVAEKDHFFSLSWEEQIAYALANHPTWLTYKADETYVTNFKITGTYSDNIVVAASEGLIDGSTRSNAERTIVVTGTWNITENQTIGSLGKIIIADGGVVNVAEGKQLNMVNEARLVVLKGGKLTGAGKVEVNNGNAEGEENYNAGTVDVASFNNNFGKFYNYGKFLVNEYIGGAQESNFYNHALAAIDHFSSTANARVFNGCQFYVKGDARLRNYEGTQGSALIAGGQLLFSGSEDGTTTPTYVNLDAGALVQAGSLYNNGTSWNGPTENGYAVVNIGKFDFMNWVQDAPQNGGYFANNIYLVADDLTNVPDGNGMQQKTDDGSENYTMSKADWKFENVVANAVGNGNTTIAEKGDYEVIPADDDFVLGEAGCTPGFKIKEGDDPIVYVDRIICEDLGSTGDFDFNDVVFDLRYADGGAYVKIRCVGGIMPLYIAGTEVHKYVNAAAEQDEIGNFKLDEFGNVSVPEFFVEGANSAAEVPVTINGKVLYTMNAKTAVEQSNAVADFMQELKAEMGQAPQKICVGTDYQWCNEYESIEAKYGEDAVKAYVQGTRTHFYK